MLRVMVECKNVRSEKLAKYLDKLTDGFKIWIHDYVVYGLFDVESLAELKGVKQKIEKS